MTHPRDRRGFGTGWTLSEESTASEREAVQWLQNTEALATARHVWANAYFMTETQGSCEVDLVVLGNGFLTVVEVKSQKGELDLDGAHWEITYRGQTEDIRQPHRQADLAAKKLKSVLARDFPEIYVGYAVLFARATARSVPTSLVNRVFGRPGSGLRPVTDICRLARRWRGGYDPVAVEERLHTLLTPAARHPADAAARRSRAASAKPRGEAVARAKPPGTQAPPDPDPAEAAQLAADLAAGAEAVEEVLKAAGFSRCVDAEERLVALQLLIASQRVAWGEVRDHVFALDAASRRHLRQLAEQFRALTGSPQEATAWLCRLLLEASMKHLGVEEVVDTALPADVEDAVQRALDRGAAVVERAALEERRRSLSAGQRKKLDGAVELLARLDELDVPPGVSLDPALLHLATANLTTLLDVVDSRRSTEQALVDACAYWPAGVLDRDALAAYSDADLLRMVMHGGSVSNARAGRVLLTLRQRLKDERAAVAAVPLKLRRHLEREPEAYEDVLQLLDWLDSLGASPAVRDGLADWNLRELARAFAELEIPDVDPLQDLPPPVAEALCGLERTARAGLAGLLLQLHRFPWPEPPDDWSRPQREVVEALRATLAHVVASGSWPTSVGKPGSVSVLELGAVVKGLERYPRAAIELLDSADDVAPAVVALVPKLERVLEIQAGTSRRSGAVEARRVLARRLREVGWAAAPEGARPAANDSDGSGTGAKPASSGRLSESPPGVEAAPAQPRTAPQADPVPASPAVVQPIYTVVQQILQVYGFPPSPPTLAPAANSPLPALDRHQPRALGGEAQSRSDAGELETWRGSPAHALEADLPSKLADCRSAALGRTELWLVEGDSVLSTAKYARNSEYQAVLPLRSKVLNAQKARRSHVLSNAECASIIRVVGAGVGEDFDLQRMRYGKVVIATDADVDGAYVRCLLITLFARCMWPVLAAGRLYIAVPPLCRVDVANGEGIYAYSDQELKQLLRRAAAQGQAFDSEPVQYRAFGEMNVDELAETTMHPATRTLRRVRPGDVGAAERALELLMGEDVGQRRDFIIDNFRRVDRGRVDV